MEVVKNKFNHVGINKEKSQAIVRPSMTYWHDAWRRLKKNKVAMAGLCILIVFTIMSIVGPMMVPYKYNENNLTNTNIGPSAQHWFGTDGLGRDIWARVWMGARISLFIGIAAAVIEGIIGIIIGGISGYFGGTIDMLIMRFVDVLIAIPALIFIILIMLIMDAGLVAIIVSFALIGWLGIARLVRGQILQLKEQEFVLAARTLGASSARLIFKHLIPNTLGVIIVSLTFAVPAAIFTEAFLSFIGLGVKPPMTSWGQLAQTGQGVLQIYPYQMIIPAIFISLTMLSFQLLGDGLRDSLDPRLRK